MAQNYCINLNSVASETVAHNSKLNWSYIEMFTPEYTFIISDVNTRLDLCIFHAQDVLVKMVMRILILVLSQA